MSSLRLPPTPTGRRQRAMRALKTVPILPSLVTLGNVFFGFLAMAKAADAAILCSENGGQLTPEAARLLLMSAELIFVAMIFDALDGAVARLTRQTSQFGAQLDSMADMVTFGVAPALISKVVIDVYRGGADPVILLSRKMVYVAAVVYVLCAAMRLARFNAEVESDEAEDHKEFAGMPTPAAAAGIAALLLLFCALIDPERSDALAFLFELGAVKWVLWSLPAALVLCGMLMVSRFPYAHVAVQLLRGGHSFPFLASIVVGVALIAIEHQIGLVVLIGGYLCSGLVLGIYRMVTTGRLDPQHELPEGYDESRDPQRN